MSDIEGAKAYIDGWQISHQDEADLKRIALSSLQALIENLEDNIFFISHDGEARLSFGGSLDDFIQPIIMDPETFKSAAKYTWGSDIDLPHCRKEMLDGLQRWRAAIDELEKMLNDRGADPASG